MGGFIGYRVYGVIQGVTEGLGSKLLKGELYRALYWVQGLGSKLLGRGVVQGIISLLRGILGV